MATIYQLHPDNPQPDRIEKIKNALQNGAVMLYPTDTVYAIGCDLKAKSGIERVRQIKQLSNDKPLTFLCPSLSNISEYATVTDQAYRTIRHLIPGPFTFVLPTTKLVPKLVVNPKRKTTGIRVPDHQVCLSLLAALGNPIISTSAPHLSENIQEGEESSVPYLEKAELFDRVEKLVDLIIDDGSEPGFQVSTIIDLTTQEPTLIRQGLGWELVSDWFESD